MKAELIAVGTELLLGQIANTNAQFISQKCAEIGVDVYFHTVVGDNAGRIRQALDIARARADVVICTGGLGPTQDDLTKDVLADYLGRKLIMHEPSLNEIRGFFAERKLNMTDSNARQAHLLEGSDPLKNETGMAVGAALTQDGTHYIVLPGPPKEMKPMFDNHAAQWLRGVMGDKQPLHSMMLKFAGIGESGLEHALIDLIDGQQDPTIAPYAKEGEVTIRLTTRAASRREADAKMEKTLEEIKRRVGEHLYAAEDIPLEAELIRLMTDKGLTLSLAESCTGGMLGDMLTAVPGSSAPFRGGVIAYSNELKRKLLGVPASLLEGEGAAGAVSSETARVMAEGVRETTGTDIGVSVTGVAGPEPSEGKPVGLIYVGIARAGVETQVHELRHAGGRELIKLKSARSAFYHLWRNLLEK